MNILRDTIDHPAAWRGADIQSKDDITVRFEPKHLQEIDVAVRAASQAGHTLDTLQNAHFPLDATAALLAQVRETLRDGAGIVVLSGIDVQRYTQAEIEMIYWGLGTYLGTGVSQSVLGDRLGHVKDFTRTDPHARAYRNNQELTPHTDQSDIVGLMCLRTARSGGMSIATSAIAVHNALVERFPEYLEPLHLGFHYHRRGEQLPGEDPVTPYRVPVFSWHDGHLSCRYVRSYIETAARESGGPLSKLETEALNCLERLTYELAFGFSLAPGDIYLINNYTVLHARTAFENWPEPERSRHLLRLWLVADGWRPLDPRLDAARHGISAQPGKTPSFERAFGQGRIATR
ncbi:TauD/TfdA family dioxygenase [Paraburkholderia sp. J41]|uniref:TauD/TfdA family dioxygenase n=1 Tax=Paraburkholderia sp. J41 TaxID=2805433 RepID=UPI002AC31140|nr:TauD/TfdA family dioxygenase [Paraburkholderia sp. J41]